MILTADPSDFYILKGAPMEIRPLDKETYAGRKFTARYRTAGYYDICPSETGFEIRYVPLETAVEKSFDDAFFGGWLEDAAA